MAYEKLRILIPAYKPDDRLNQLIDDLKASGFGGIVVVDDGGGEAYAPFFRKAEEQGAKVLRHEVNRGKGAALKTGLAYISGADPRCHVVTADADGQHTPGDIKKLADAIAEYPNALLLGSRDKKQMPPRSRAGNTLTCVVFGLTTGLWLGDTQTGLRVLPPETLARFSKIDGDRYEYEMNMLIIAKRENVPVKEIGIETVYIDDNKSSHFNALKDGLRIYGLLFRQFGAYAGSSLIATGVDYALAILLRMFFPEAVAIPTYSARAVSSLVNFLINKKLVFKDKPDNKLAIVKYYALVVIVAILQVQIIRLLTMVFGFPYLLGKIIADGTLFLVNYKLQQKLVFQKIRKGK